MEGLLRHSSALFIIVPFMASLSPKDFLQQTNSQIQKSQSNYAKTGG
ncbi:hypothetical protein ADICYQ_2884 [Cyclobacterium qasimii M12-11B]|uniref:Uncharacterized protein n=1 Tax=Cyclobacterium qasimii M12-11B TaxID=641524 RepID=S7WN75_9BACT|nr:hypothetical protein ADICYQ_2884 [Cyclobacterium qasimii M12-11B]